MYEEWDECEINSVEETKDFRDLHSHYFTDILLLFKYFKLFFFVRRNA